LPAAEEDPRGQLVGSQTIGDRREEIERRRLALKINFVGMIHVGDAGRDRIESLESAH